MRMRQHPNSPPTVETEAAEAEIVTEAPLAVTGTVAAAIVATEVNEVIVATEVNAAKEATGTIAEIAATAESVSTPAPAAIPSPRRHPTYQKSSRPEAVETTTLLQRGSARDAKRGHS